jgi:capsular polysaccharide biosynthesis protein
MLDVGQRIQLVIDNINQQDLTHYKFLIPKKYFENEYVKSVVEIYKIKYILLEDHKLYKIKNLIIPFHLAPSGNYNPFVVRKMRNTFHNSHKQMVTQNNEKIWISRQNSRIRKIKNFHEVEKILKSNGFHIVDFDKKNLFEQIKIVINADVLGGLHGGGLANMLFLKQGKKIIEIRGMNDKSNNCYFSLASALNLEYYYFLASVKDEDFYHNDYTIDEEKFSSFFNTYFS